MDDFDAWYREVEDAKAFVSVPLFRMVVTSCLSVSSLVPWLLEEVGLEYVLTGQFSQDPLEVRSARQTPPIQLGPLCRPFLGT